MLTGLYHQGDVLPLRCVGDWRHYQQLAVTPTLGSRGFVEHVRTERLEELASSGIREVFARNLRRAASRRACHRGLGVGIDRTYVSALERGVYGATVAMVEKLAAVLGVEPRIARLRSLRGGIFWKTALMNKQTPDS